MNIFMARQAIPKHVIDNHLPSQRSRDSWSAAAQRSEAAAFAEAEAEALRPPSGVLE
jgi:predicted anti-sigma-YlaC factor YlaD